jgi:predicted kinase
MLIVMAGFPGTGKSTIANRLAERLGGVVLNKDALRAALFPGPVLDYSREQDDLTMEAIYAASRNILASGNASVIIDGRTFSKAYQVRDLFAAADRIGQSPRIIQCVASDDVIRTRLQRDAETDSHPAKNRSFDLYLAVKAAAEPLTVPHLVLDTGSLPLNECVERAIRFVIT